MGKGIEDKKHSDRNSDTAKRQAERLAVTFEYCDIEGTVRIKKHFIPQINPLFTHGTNIDFTAPDI
jgi:hypothetical protein